MAYFPLSEKDTLAMLSTIGVASVEELLGDIPASLRKFQLDLPRSLNEMELMREIAGFARECRSAVEMPLYTGAGSYEHFIPAVVDRIVSRSEFYTPYTPYQPEASQGTLQAVYEYQTAMCRLTGMDVAQASHYDGATSMVEAVLMALSATGRKTVLVAKSVHPEYRELLRTYLESTEFAIREVAYDGDCGTLDRMDLAGHFDATQGGDELGCLIVQSPNVFGALEELSDVIGQVHERGGKVILVANPLSFGVARSGGEWGVDIVCGDAQSFGNPPSYGGPSVGYITAKKDFVRKMPGRLVGATRDRNDNRCYVLTLQAREQHIRRERACSNICTNQALCALAALVYLTAVGEAGLCSIAERNIQNAVYLQNRFEKAGLRVRFKNVIFNEFVVQHERVSATQIREGLLKRGIVGGLPLDAWYPELAGAGLWCVTETKTKEDLDVVAYAVREVVNE